jgi:hypothetical protein
MTTKETEIVEESKPEDQPKEEAKGLRAQVERLSKENRELKVEKRDAAIDKLGLKPDAGLGMALVEQFDAGNLPLDDIAKVATEKYGHVVPDPEPAQHPQAQQIAQGHQNLDDLGGAAGSIQPPNEQEAVAKAEADKNFDATLAYKSKQLGDMLHPNT